MLRRRNAPSLRLSDASRDDERAQAFDALARLLRNLLVHSPAGLEEAVDDVFPWVTLLPKRDRVAFVDELGRTLVAASALDSYAPVVQLLQEWRGNGRGPRRPATRPSPAYRHRRRRRPGRGAGRLTHGAKAEGTGSASAGARRLGVPLLDERRGQGMGAGLLRCACQRSRGLGADHHRPQAAGQPPAPAEGISRCSHRERGGAGAVAIRGHRRWTHLVLHRRRSQDRLDDRCPRRPPEGDRVGAPVAATRTSHRGRRVACPRFVSSLSANEAKSGGTGQHEATRDRARNAL